MEPEGSMIIDLVASVALVFFAIVILAVGITLAAIFGVAFFAICGIFDLGMTLLRFVWRVR